MSFIPFPDISPEIVAIDAFGLHLALRWYALAYIAGILIGWRLILRMIAVPRLWSGTPPLDAEQVEQLVTWVILGVILGGRLGFVLFYQPDYYFAHPAEIVKVWEGGMSFHGGFLGVLTALVGFCLKQRVSILSVADLLAAATPPGLFLGRIANFINGELWGRPTTLPWGVAFPGEAAQTCPGVELICARHPSQLYEAGLEGLLLFLLLATLVWRRGWLHMPGAVGGAFLSGYGVARFLVEFVRQPDAQFVTEGNPLGLAWQIGGYGLTMGQMLSLPMIVLGLFLIVRARRAA